MGKLVNVVIGVLFIALVGFKKEKTGGGKIDVAHVPSKGFYSARPARNWEESLVSGNGTMGAMVSGHVAHDSITFNQTQLFLPFHQPLLPPSQGKHLEEIRALLLAGKYQEASQYVVDLAKTEGYNGKHSSDPYIPAFRLEVVHDAAAAIKSYARTTDFQSGEVTVKWEEQNGTFSRQLFISRPDNLIVMRLRANERGTINTTLSLSRILTADPKRIQKLNISPNLGIDRVAAAAEKGRLSFRAWYAKTWEGNFQGYEGVLRVVHSGGSYTTQGDKMILRNADEVLLIGRIQPSMDMNVSQVATLAAALQTYAPDYDQLLARHRTVHQALFDRVSLDLDAAPADRRKSSEDLLQMGGANKALIERIFNAARYNILSATGMNPPKLQGIWGATMTPPWASDYTTNGNLPVAISHYLQANTPELLLPLFDKLESMMEDFQTNARVLYNCRGIHIPSHIATRGFDNEFDATWPMTFWTAGAPWYALFYYDYYLYTRDKKFLRERALPFMKEAEIFYEDFLKEGPDGNYIFCPSYSPENNPANGKSQACINATMDIMAAKALFRAIIRSSKILGVHQEKIPKWEAMLRKMPPYKVNEKGELREWLWDGLQDNHNHRHASHLFGLYDLHDPEIMGNPELVRGAKQVIDRRMEIRRKDNGGVMAFGMMHLAFSAAALREAETATDILTWLGNSYWNNNMVSTHDPKNIFNVDISGGYPSLVMKMLAYADLGEVSLLPCLPYAWTKGAIKGMALRGGILVDALTWNGTAGQVTLTSKIDQVIHLEVKGQDKGSVRLQAGKPENIKWK
ncbi:glycoside hydrolase family 95 protein [Paraflavisolibacter sp. H34]|uniref:glycoside hydrolase family 95 protein n=1 Tax=Huijunlia imazamoxiresistens TaxID=3127457 RepID=UPI0030172F41